MTEEHTSMRNDKSFPDKELRGVLKLPFVLKGRLSVLEVQGSDSIDLLNRLSTNKIAGASAGDVVETILTTEKGRVLDVILVLVRENGLLLLCSQQMINSTLSWLEKYTIMEDVEYILRTSECEVYNFIGTHDSDMKPASDWTWQQDAFGLDGVISARHSSLRGAGHIAIVPKDRTSEFDEYLRNNNSEVVPASEHDYRLWRISNTVPDVGYELTEQANPLEAGAKAAVDFEKGCYIGQEVIARLDSYDKVQRQIVKVQFDGSDPLNAEPGTAVTADGKKAGFLTTVESDPVKGIVVGLACIRHSFAVTGTTLSIQIDENSRTLHVV